MISSTLLCQKTWHKSILTLLGKLHAPPHDMLYHYTLTADNNALLPSLLLYNDIHHLWSFNSDITSNNQCCLFQITFSLQTVQQKVQVSSTTTVLCSGGFYILSKHAHCFKSCSQVEISQFCQCYFLAKDAAIPSYTVDSPPPPTVMSLLM